MRMRLATMVCAGLVATMSFVATTSVHAQGTAEEIVVDSINLKDADMIAATRMLTQKTGLQFLIEPTSELLPKITLSLNKMSAEDALRYICQAAGCTFRRDPNGVYIISKGKAVEVSTTSRPTNTPKLNLITKKVKLLKADAGDVLNQVRFGNNFVPKNFEADFDKYARKTAGPNTRIIGGTNILGLSSAPLDTRSIKTSSEGSNDIVLPGESAGQDFGGAGGGFGGRGGGGQGGGQGGGIGGQGGGQGGQTNLTAGQGLVPGSIDFISYDPTDNSIIVRGTDEDIAELQRMISLFDVAPKQVIIKVEFVTTSSSLAKSLGFDWLYERGTLFAGVRPGSFARAGDPIFLNFASGNFTTRMRALLQDGWGRVVQAPVIRTLNNQPAFVNSSISTTIFITTLVAGGNGTVIRAPQLVNITASTALGVAPRINEDGTVTTFINVQLQDFGQLRRSADGAEFPDILSQQIGVVARVKSGETIALGGLTRKSDTGSASRFPILGDLPVIGQFFRSSNRDKVTSELIIFVTPTVIEDEGNLGIGP